MRSQIYSGYQREVSAFFASCRLSSPAAGAQLFWAKSVGLGSAIFAMPLTSSQKASFRGGGWEPLVRPRRTGVHLGPARHAQADQQNHGQDRRCSHCDRPQKINKQLHFHSMIRLPVDLKVTIRLCPPNLLPGQPLPRIISRLATPHNGIDHSEQRSKQQLFPVGNYAPCYYSDASTSTFVALFLRRDPLCVFWQPFSF